MIKGALTASVECLENEGIQHDLFISETDRELHLWDVSKLEVTIKLLASRDVVIDSIVRKLNDLYVIKF